MYIVDRRAYTTTVDKILPDLSNTFVDINK